MIEQTRTRSLPFGADVDTMIVCMNDEQRRRAIEALGMQARYELIDSVLIGYRFNKIIVLLGGTGPWSETEAENIGLIIKEKLPTHLDIGGKLYVI